MDIKFEENKLFLPVSKIAFKYNIESIIQVKLGVIVLLDMPMDSDDTNNIYAIDLNGKKIWKIQPLNEVFPEIKKFTPYVGITLLKNGNNRSHYRHVCNLKHITCHFVHQ